jgi:MoaA/NifB/PqqE/SkfB family radical SAM enzyme
MASVVAKPWVELWFELETRCNLKCPFCYNYWKSGKLPEPSRANTSATVVGLRRLLASVDCRKMALSGGEPLLRSDLLELLAVVQEFQVPVVLTTNGVLLTSGRLRDLISAGITNFQVPFHSHQPAIHGLLSGAPCWENSLRAILLVQSCGAGITPVFVATALNVKHFGEVVRILGELGLRRIIFNRFIPSGFGERHRDKIGVPSEPELIDNIDEAQSVARAYRLTIELGVPIEVPRDLRARWTQVSFASCPVHSGQRRWTIGSDLSIRRCNHSGNNIGHLFDDGVERLLAELEAGDPETLQEEEMRPCQFLYPRALVQIGIS